MQLDHVDVTFDIAISLAWTPVLSHQLAFAFVVLKTGITFLVCMYDHLICLLHSGTEDFTSSPVMVTFGVNDTLACANISITDDTIVEPNENFDVTFSVPGDVSRGTIQMSTVTIIDNDG